MKRITIQKEQEIQIGGRMGKFSYEHTLIDILGARDLSTQKGFSINEIRLSTKIIDKVEEAKKAGLTYIDLEDDAHAHLAHLVKETNWAFANKAVLEFVDQILEAKEPK